MIKGVIGMKTDMFTNDTLKKVHERTIEKMKEQEKALIDKAKSMDNADNYIELTEFCYKEVRKFVGNDEDLEQILTYPQITSKIFNTIVDTDEFKKFEAEEVRRFPRVVLMTVVTGSESIACQAAEEVYADDKEAIEQFEELKKVYHGYLQDALAYGRGEKKNISFTGNPD